MDYMTMIKDDEPQEEEEISDKFLCCVCFKNEDGLELEVKRKERSQAVYERKKQLIKLRTKAEKVAEEKLGAQLDVLAPIKY
ncbi:hypothetical protein F2Q69_00053448 [Brassica cretica]|uniref:Uncharacterized protein n=1 Tax=Brassica cretica TaxID=69181 RepID=A0A8S9MZF4_BRACR|nr:hypothetical protein F2Q69_00053448 [Brassica cretica]